MKVPNSSAGPKPTSPKNSATPLSSSKKPTGPISMSGGNNVRVVCRVRPMNEKEKLILEQERKDAKGNKVREVCTEFFRDDKTGILVFTPNEKPVSAELFEKHTFNFDYVFDCDST